MESVELIQKHDRYDDYYKDIMFNIGNTSSELRRKQLESDLNFRIRSVNEIHGWIREKENNNFCLSWGFFIKCECCGQKIIFPEHCKDKKLCPACNEKYSNKRGIVIYETFEELKSEYIIHEVLTFPYDYFDNDLKKHDIIKSIHKLASQYVKEVYGEYVGFVSKVHTWSTKQPLSEPHFHIHLLISGKKYFPIYQDKFEGKKEIVDFAMKDFKVHQEFIEILRLTWQNILDYPDEVNVHHRYSNKPKQKAFWCKYITRDAIYDINEYLKKHGENYSCSDEQETFYDYQTESKQYFKSIRWGGTFSDHRRGKLIKVMRLKKMNAGEKQKDKTKMVSICPHCYAKVDKSQARKYVRIKEGDSKNFAIRISEQEYEKFVKRKTKKN